MDAVTAGVIGYGLGGGGFVWVCYWEWRERRIQAWLETVRIKFRAVADDHPEWPGYFVWVPRNLRPLRQSATESTQAWWDSLDVEDQERIEQLDETGRVA